MSGKGCVGFVSVSGTGNGAVKALRHIEDYLRRVDYTVFDPSP